jgi:YD repeat-containing protein
MRALAFFTLLNALAAAAHAAETATYTYDARGRLVTVAHSGGPSSGATTTYTLDKAENRSSKVTSGLGGGGGGGVSFSVSSNGAVTEGANSVFTITKAGTASVSMSVDYATANNTAVAPGDYTSKSGTLTFTTSQASKTVSVTTVNDAAVESAETFKLNLSSPTGGSTLGTASATATINDNDGGGGNQPPIANPDTGGQILTCGNIDINVISNDTDPDNNLPLSLVSASAVSAGIIVTKVNTTTVNVESGGENTGTKTFDYVVQDSLGATATGTGTVTVNAGGFCP